MHYYALVEIPADAENIDAAVEEAMAPHRENDDGEGIWDWWVVGGRWTGHLDGYRPANDRRNMEVCWLCQGTGQRPDHVVTGCNGCDSTGISIKFASKWARHEGDVALRQSIGEEPFTLITSGHAYSKERWDGDNFVDTTGELAKAWEALSPDARLVVVDYHC